MTIFSIFHDFEWKIGSVRPKEEKLVSAETEYSAALAETEYSAEYSAENDTRNRTFFVCHFFQRHIFVSSICNLKLS